MGRDGAVCIKACDIKGCAPDKVWGIVRDDKLYRLTFSQSLAEHILSKTDGYEMKRLTFVTGRELKAGEQSSTGLYAILDRRKGIVLRISLIQEAAELMRSDSRYITEAHIAQ